MNIRNIVLCVCFCSSLACPVSFHKPLSTTSRLLTNPQSIIDSPFPHLAKSDPSTMTLTATIPVLIKDFYVQPVGDKALLDDAIRGMVSG